MLYVKNLSPKPGIHETALYHAELYTIMIDEEAKGGKGAIKKVFSIAQRLETIFRDCKSKE